MRWYIELRLSKARFEHVQSRDIIKKALQVLLIVFLSYMLILFSKSHSSSTYYDGECIVDNKTLLNLHIMSSRGLKVKINGNNMLKVTSIPQKDVVALTTASQCKCQTDRRRVNIRKHGAASILLVGKPGIVCQIQASFCASQSSIFRIVNILLLCFITASIKPNMFCLQHQ